MRPIIENNRNKIVELCKQFHVKELYVFGSVVRDDFNAESDVDFMATFSIKTDDTATDLSTDYYEMQDNLKAQLQLLLNRQVDLVVENNIRNRYLRYFINQEKKLLYAEA